MGTLTGLDGQRIFDDKHAEGYHKSIGRVNYFLVSVRMEREGVEKAKVEGRPSGDGDPGCESGKS